MNELEMMERRLHSWTPRRPSRTLEGRIFGRPPAPVADAPATCAVRGGGFAGCFRFPVARWGWYSPVAMAVVVLGIVTFSETAFPPMTEERARTVSNGRSERDGRFFANAAWSNREMVAYYSTESHSSQNHWWRPILGWTNTLPVP